MTTEQISLIYNIIGMGGTLSFLVAYFMLQKDKWKYDGLAYLLANLIGALCLITSLTYHWNLASFLLECAWLSISAYGLFKWWKKRGAPV